MTVWDKYYYKGKMDVKTPNVSRNKHKNNYKLCRICGSPITSGSLCRSCSKFIKDKRKEEGRGSNEHRRIETNDRKADGNTKYSSYRGNGRRKYSTG